MAPQAQQCPLLWLPVDIFDLVLQETLYTVGVFEAVRLRLVCRLFDTAVQRTLYSSRAFEGYRWPHRYEHIARMSRTMRARLVLHKLGCPRTQSSPLCAAILGAIFFLRDAYLVASAEDEARVTAALADLAASTLKFPDLTRNLGGTDDHQLGCISNARQVALIAAIALKDRDLVLHVLAAGARLNRPGVLFGSPLSLAAHLDDVDMFQLLVNLGACQDGSVIFDDRPGLLWFRTCCPSPIEAAASAGNHRILDAMFSGGTYKNKPTERMVIAYTQALLNAAKREGDDVALRIWDEKPDNWYPHEDSVTLAPTRMHARVGESKLRSILSAASGQGHVDLLKRMLEDESVHPLVKDMMNDPKLLPELLNLASVHGRDGVVRMLFVKYTKDQLVRENSMGYAAEGGSVKVLKLLAQHGAHIREHGDSDAYDSELFAALTHGHFEAVQFFLSHGADLERGACGQEALCYAAREGRDSTVRRIVDLGISVNMPPNHRLNPIVSAMSYSQDRIVKLLLELGADPVQPQDSFHSHAVLTGYWPFRFPLTEEEHRNTLCSPKNAVSAL